MDPIVFQMNKRTILKEEGRQTQGIYKDSIWPHTQHLGQGTKKDCKIPWIIFTCFFCSKMGKAILKQFWLHYRIEKRSSYCWEIEYSLWKKGDTTMDWEKAKKNTMNEIIDIDSDLQCYINFRNHIRNT